MIVLAAAADGLDLTNYTVEKTELSVPADVRPCAAGLDEYHLFDNFLRFAGLPSRVRLARSATWNASHDFGRAGLDFDTLKLHWLDSERLLWITWRTTPQGNGMYTQEGHLVLLVEGEQVKELFRDSIYARGSGRDGGTACHLQINYKPDRKHLTLQHTHTNWTRGDDLQVDPARGDTVQSVWKYRLEKAGLRFMDGERSADFVDERPLNQLGIGMDIPVPKLIRLNPQLKTKKIVRGHVRIDDKLPEYKPEMRDGICE